MAQQDMQNLISDWMKQQQKLWQELQQGSRGGDAAQPWDQGLSHWRKAVEQTLETQKKAMLTWADQVTGAEEVPEELKRWAKDGASLIEQWSGAQEEMWRQWFDLMGRSPFGTNDDQVEQFKTGWEQMAAQMQTLQRQWADAFSSAAGSATSQGGKKSGKK
jgi:hypothetical protein